MNNIDEKELDELLKVQVNSLNLRGKLWLSDFLLDMTRRGFRGYIKSDNNVIQTN